MKDYSRWGSGLANVIIIPHQKVDRWTVNIDGDGSHYMDTFETEHGARCWAIDILVAYFGWSTGLAMETIEDCIRTRTWKSTDPRFTEATS